MRSCVEVDSPLVVAAGFGVVLGLASTSTIMSTTTPSPMSAKSVDRGISLRAVQRCARLRADRAVAGSPWRAGGDDATNALERLHAAFRHRSEVAGDRSGVRAERGEALLELGDRGAARAHAEVGREHVPVGGNRACGGSRRRGRRRRSRA